MMLTVGICDDCPEHAALLEKTISGYQCGDTLRIVQSTDPHRFLAIVQEEAPRLVFLDIDMNGMNGIELGEKIKAMDADTVIVYVTAHEKYALEAFRVHAFHYLIKPITQDKVTSVMAEALAFIKRNKSPGSENNFIIQRRGETISLNFDDISYFEKIGHKVRVITANGCEEYYGNFTRLVEQFDTAQFIQCHQGYIVNVPKIRAFRNKTLFLEDGFQVPVSRTCLEKVRIALAKRLFAGKDGV